jgi:hypothetical protein
MRVLISCFAAIVMVLTWGYSPALAAETRFGTGVDSAPATAAAAVAVLEDSVLKEIGELRNTAFGATNQGQFDLASLGRTF